MNRRLFWWFGHVERLDEGRWPRKVKAAKVEGQQGRGRPRFGWLDGVKRALAVMEVGLQETTQLVRERSVWRELVLVWLYWCSPKSVGTCVWPAVYAGWADGFTREVTSMMVRGLTSLGCQALYLKSGLASYPDPSGEWGSKSHRTKVWMEWEE